MFKHQSLKSFPVNSKNTSFSVGLSENIFEYATFFHANNLLIHLDYPYPFYKQSLEYFLDNLNLKQF